MASLIIIKTGDAFPEVVDQHGDFEQLFIHRLHEALPEGVTLKVWDARLTATPPDDIVGAVITGSHSMVSEQPPLSASLQGSAWLTMAWEPVISRPSMSSSGGRAAAPGDSSPECPHAAAA